MAGENYLGTKYHVAAVLAFMAGLAAWGAILADGAGAIDLWDHDDKRKDGMFNVAILAYIAAIAAIGLAMRPALGKHQFDNLNSLSKDHPIERTALAALLVICSFYLASSIDRDNEMMMAINGYLCALSLIGTMIALSHDRKDATDTSFMTPDLDSGWARYARWAIAAVLGISTLGAVLLVDNTQEAFDQALTGDLSYCMAGYLGLLSVAGILTLQSWFKKEEKTDYSGYERLSYLGLTLSLLTIAYGACNMMVHSPTDERLESGLLYGAMAISSGITACFAARSMFSEGQRKPFI